MFIINVMYILQNKVCCNFICYFNKKILMSKNLFGAFVGSYVRQIGRNVANDHYYQETEKDYSNTEKSEEKLEIPSILTYILWAIFIFPGIFIMFIKGVKRYFSNKIKYSYKTTVDTYVSDRRYKSGKRYNGTAIETQYVYYDKSSNPHGKDDVRLYNTHAVIYMLPFLFLLSLSIVSIFCISDTEVGPQNSEHNNKIENINDWIQTSYTVNTGTTFPTVVNEDVDVNEFGKDQYGNDVILTDYTFMYKLGENKIGDIIYDCILVNDNDSLYLCINSSYDFIINSTNNKVVNAIINNKPQELIISNIDITQKFYTFENTDMSYRVYYLNICQKDIQDISIYTYYTKYGEPYKGKVTFKNIN